MKKIFVLLGFSMILIAQTRAQTERRPFTLVALGVTITGTYSEGFLKSKTVNGTSILWGLVSWGGSNEITCLPGNAVCRIETITSISFNRTVTNDRGELCFEPVKVPNGNTPVLVGQKDGALTFAVDINQTDEAQRSGYTGKYYEVKSPFVLDPLAVKKLNLSKDADDKGYVIPAGRYPLYRDGNIYFWTFTPPTK